MQKILIESRSNPEELVYMFSEALRIMDRNTELLMIDEMKVEAEQLNITLAETKSELSNTKTELSSTKTELSSVKTENEELKATIEALTAELGKYKKN